jgi:hypothetical protein
LRRFELTDHVLCDGSTVRMAALALEANCNLMRHSTLGKWAAVATAFLAALATGSAQAADHCDSLRTSLVREAIFSRARRVEPAPKSQPARELNISDEEVREIQRLAEPLIGKVTVSVGTVTTGCPCEEGPLCKDQVWVYALARNRTVGLQFSRVSDHWKIGVVQQWWLDHDAITRASGGWSFGVDGAQGEHIDRFPTCGVDATRIQYAIEAARKCAAGP